MKVDVDITGGAATACHIYLFKHAVFLENICYQILQHGALADGAKGM